MKIMIQICLCIFFYLNIQPSRGSTRSAFNHRTENGISEETIESLIWFATSPPEWAKFQQMLKVSQKKSERNDLLASPDLHPDQYFLPPKPLTYMNKNSQDYTYRTRLIQNLAWQIPKISKRQTGIEHQLTGAFKDIRWSIKRSLNHGTFGTVYEVVFKLPGKNESLSFAFKRLSHLTPAEIFEKEIRMLNQFNGHPRFLSYYGSFKGSEDETIIALELMDGDLTDPDCQYSRQLFKDLVAGMLTLKENRIFHGDLKNENLLFKGPRLYIADLGGSAPAQPGYSHPNVTRTVATNAPEYHLYSTEFDQRQTHIRLSKALKDPFKADVFSAGVTLIEKKHGNIACFAQKLAEKRTGKYGSKFKFWSTYQALLLKYFRFHMIRQLLPDPEDRIILKMIQPDPQKRISIEKLSELVKKLS